jgi:hypothetical protein
MAGYVKEYFMLKKKIIFGGVALLLAAALFTLPGCSQATGSDGAVTSYSENHLFGTADADAVARAVASARRTGRAVVLTDGLEIIGPTGNLSPLNSPTAVSFEDRSVRVEGRITIKGNVIVNGAFADLNFVENAGITVQGGGAFIYSGTQDVIYTAADDSGFKVKYVANPLEAAQGTDARIAVPSYKLWTPVASHVTHLYVVDKVTVDSLSETPVGTVASGKPRIIALGEVDLAESNSAAFDYTPFGSGEPGFIFARSATVTSSATGPVTMGLPASAALPAINADTPIVVTTGVSPANITMLIIEKAESPVTISAAQISALALNQVTSSGKVTVDTQSLNGTTTIPENAGEVAITAGAISGTVTIGTDTQANTGAISLTATGTLMSEITVTANTGNITISNTHVTNGVGGAVKVKSNSGSLTVNAPAIAGGVTVDSNTKDLIFAVPSITTAVTVKRNERAGNITFSKALNLTTVNLIVVPVNYGSVNFLGSLNATGVLGGNTPTTAIAGSGSVVFGGAATLGANTVIDCDTVFSGGLTALGALILGGDITLPYNQAITLNGAFTLRSDKRILVGASSPIPVLAAGNKDVVITPTAGAKLAAISKDPDDEEDLNDRTLHVTTKSLTDFTNNLLVKAGGILSVDVASGLNVGVTGVLTLEEGAMLAIPAAGTANSVVLGDTRISGTAAGADSRLTARNGPVSLAANKLSGKGSTLAMVEDLGNGTITAGGASLDIEGLNLDLSLNGILKIPGNATARKVTLIAGTANPGRITLSEDLEAEAVTYSFNGNAIAASAALSGTGVLRADDTTGTVAIQDLAAGPGSNVVITGSVTPGTDASIAAGVSVVLP